jgi:aspartyl-tRNA synthetase
MRTVDFKVFRAAADLPNGRVAALRLPGGGTLTRKEIDDYTTFVKIYGIGGLAYIKVNDAAKPNEEGLQSPNREVSCPAASASSTVLERTGAQTGDVIFFAADREKVVNDALGALRARVGTDRGLAESGWKPPVGRRFPDVRIRRRKEVLGRAPSPVHSRPRTGTRSCSRPTPGQAIAKAYDVVMNGWEIGGGSVRIHKAGSAGEGLRRARDQPGGPAQEVRLPARRASPYGAPPHGGIAFGLDRLVAMMAGVEQIRDVIAFPKTQRGQDLLVDAAQRRHRAATARPAHPGACHGLGPLPRLAGPLAPAVRLVENRPMISCTSVDI